MKINKLIIGIFCLFSFSIFSLESDKLQNVSFSFKTKKDCEVFIKNVENIDAIMALDGTPFLFIDISFNAPKSRSEIEDLIKKYKLNVRDFEHYQPLGNEPENDDD